ncbi:MAG: endonuclease/exonuclease/phosphatase family protein [Dermatophilaceae bacterium]
MHVIRVATYNLRDFLDDWRLAARLVRAVDPDVLCLQEVPRRLGGGWRTARFAERCGMQWTGSHRGSGGTTVFTSPRVTVVDARHLSLPVRWPDRTRGFAVVRVSTPTGESLTVVSVHLSLRRAERVAHTERVLRALDGPGPLVVAGDLNEDETGAAWRLIDVPDRLRLVGPSGPTYPSRSPRRRLDVLFASPSLVPRRPSEVAVPEAVWSRASDHRPAWVDLEVPTA